MSAPQPDLDPDTVKFRGEACVEYEAEGSECGSVYAKEGDTERTLFANPPEGEDEIPDEVDVSYYGNRYEAELCFKDPRETGDYNVPAVCWGTSSTA